MWYQPSRIASAVASGLFQYPRMTLGPWAMTSPISPGATSRPSGVTTRPSTQKCGRPAEPDLRKASSLSSR